MPNTREGAPAAAPSSLATQIVETMTSRSLRLAFAESLSGGALASAVVEVPGASAMFLGSIVAYNSALKSGLLGVDAGLLARVGAVDAEVAAQMASGVRSRMAAAAGVAQDSVFGVSCTGVAGPDMQDGKPVGTVFVSVDGPAGTKVQELHLAGSRAEIRAGVVVAALHMLSDALRL